MLGKEQTLPKGSEEAHCSGDELKKIPSTATLHSSEMSLAHLSENSILNGVSSNGTAQGSGSTSAMLYSERSFHTQCL